jgi:hypothetical protein
MRSGWFLLLLPVLMAAGCGDKKPEVTQETLAASCRRYLQTSCERYTDCLAPSRTDTSKSRDDYIKECVANNVLQDGACMDRFARSECPAEEQEANDRCEGNVRKAECSSLCAGEDFIFCWHPCLYYCPPRAK